VCGRIGLHTPPARVARLLHAELAAGMDPEGTPRWNLSPTEGVLAMAPVGSPGLDREQAIALVAEAQALHGRLQRLKEGIERTLAEDNSAENR
jgi:hypothetical protein